LTLESPAVLTIGICNECFGGKMKDASQTYDVKIARGCLVLIGIAVLLWAVGTSSAQESQGISKLPLWSATSKVNCQLDRPGQRHAQH
jgi:hypothetical protein